MLDARKNQATSFIAFALSVVIVPALLQTIGVPPSIVMTVATFGTILVWIWGYRPATMARVFAVIAGSLFILWSLHRETNYAVKYQICRTHNWHIIDQRALVDSYIIQVRLDNQSSFKLWAQVKEAALSLGDDASSLPTNGPPVPLVPGIIGTGIVDQVSFTPTISTDDILSGHMRYVVTMGRTPDDLKKPMVISGTVNIAFTPGGGDSILSFNPDRDSSLNADPRPCRLTTQKHDKRISRP